MAKYRKLSRTSSQRKALLRGQVTALLNNGKIVTTEAKAKEIRKVAEKLIALAVREKDNFETVTVDAKVAKKDENGNEIDPTVKVKITVNDETVYSDSNRKDETEIISEISGKGTVTVKVWVNEIKKITKQFDLSVDDPVLTID